MSRKKKTIQPVRATPEAFLRELDAFGHHRSRWEKLHDFFEASFCALAKTTAPSPQAADELEARYARVAAKYGGDEIVQEHFGKLLGLTGLALGEQAQDFLGSVYMSAEVHNRRTGQFFSPWPIARMMAALQFDADEVREKIAEGRPITLMEPAAGSGVMVLAFAEAMREVGIDPGQHLFATTVDVDPSCVKMAFIQLSMSGIPACCIIGNSLSLEIFGHAYTPAAVRQHYRQIVNTNPAALLEAG